MTNEQLAALDRFAEEHSPVISVAALALILRQAASAVQLRAEYERSISNRIRARKYDALAARLVNATWA